MINIFIKDNIRFINTRDLVERDTAFDNYDYFRYCILGDGHPTSHYNKLLCDEIKKYIINYDSYALFCESVNKQLSGPKNIDYYKLKINLDRKWFKAVSAKANVRGITVDSMITLDAEYLFELENKKKK